MNASVRQRKRALIVDDEPTIVELLGITLEGMGVEVLACHSLAEAFAALGKGPPSLCLTDLRLGDGSGMQLLHKVRELYPQVPVAVITAYASAEGAVEAMRAGAFDFMTKPIELARLRRLVSEAIALGELPRESVDLSERLVGESPGMVALRERVRLLGRSNAPVHIRGESGTGKELVARAIHDASPRREKAFIAVNCGAIPENLMESEFFGAEKGAYSGAVQRREGLFVAANGGTLFLDEIAELPLTTQVKLLRVLQERVVRPLGGLREQSIDIRLICATHRDLRRMVEEGTFREDLFYRINVVPIEFRPCANAARTSRYWRKRYCSASASGTDVPRRTSPPLRWPGCPTAISRATYVSWRTSWSGRSPYSHSHCCTGKIWSPRRSSRWRGRHCPLPHPPRTRPSPSAWPRQSGAIWPTCRSALAIDPRKWQRPWA